MKYFQLGMKMTAFGAAFIWCCDLPIATLIIKKSDSDCVLILKNIIWREMAISFFTNFFLTTS